MSKHFDVVIVGGAIVGSSTAYYLRKNGFAGSIAIVEKDPSYKQSCTALSWGGIRRQFSTPENIKLSEFGLKLVRGLKQEFGPDADIGFKEQGYLVMASEASVPVLEENAALQVSMGADTVIYSRAELEQKFPWIQFHGIEAGSFGRSSEGWFDPYQFMNLIRKAALSKNVEFITDEVVAIDVDGKVTSVTLKSGAKLGAGHVVNAGGTSGGAIAGMVGFDLPVSAAKRYVYVIDCPTASDAMRKGPLTFDINGAYFRPEGRNFIWGYTPTEEEEPQVKDWEMDFPLYEEKLWPLLAERVPVFETVKMVGHWVGHYDYNWFDQNGIIGRHPTLPNFYFGNGFSGHGIQQGPATGNAIAELIMFGEYRTIDLTKLRVERIAANEPVFEKNIF
jgi:FAD-dependent oxidoreductase domain-containing protein 1